LVKMNRGQLLLLSGEHCFSDGRDSRPSSELICSAALRRHFDIRASAMPN
jgi:hypothetical protein